MIAAAHRRRQAPTLEMLDRLYELPRDGRSIDDWHRARHYDLPTLDDLALACEDHRVMTRLAYDPGRARREWLVGRRLAIAEERRRRGRSSISQKSPSNSPAPGNTGEWTPTPIRGGGRRGR